MVDDTYNGCDLDRDLGNRENDVKGKKMMLNILSIVWNNDCYWRSPAWLVSNIHLVLLLDLEMLTNFFSATYK